MNTLIEKTILDLDSYYADVQPVPNFMDISRNFRGYSQDPPGSLYVGWASV